MIQYISNSNARYDHLQGIVMALEGGCRWIQLRMKDCKDEEVASVALKAQALCQEYGAKLIIDDKVMVVKELNLDGVHLGKNDMPVGAARSLLGKDKIIGGTANTFEDVERLCQEGADYIGLGPFRFTTTKKNLSPILGLQGYEHVVGRMKEAGIDLPVVAIGGITEADVLSVMQTGVSGIALSGAVLNAECPVEAMHRFVQLEGRQCNG